MMSQDWNKGKEQKINKKKLCQLREKKQLHRFHCMTRHVSLSAQLERPLVDNLSSLNSDKHFKCQQYDSFNLFKLDVIVLFLAKQKVT